MRLPGDPFLRRPCDVRADRQLGERHGTDDRFVRQVVRDRLGAAGPLGVLAISHDEDLLDVWADRTVRLPAVSADGPAGALPADHW